MIYYLIDKLISFQTFVRVYVLNTKHYFHDNGRELIYKL